MLNPVHTTLKALALSAALLPIAAQSAIINLSASLSAANQDGSTPFADSDVVPTTATGDIAFQLDTTNKTLDFQMTVDGILLSELLDFGPNSTPIHLHQPGGGVKGNFGPISIDLALGSADDDFAATDTGFTFSRTGVSILLADQGGVALAGC
ncbi:MAG: CHRD domain-containing protein [Gammaproteobacteria bacterium]